MELLPVIYNSLLIAAGLFVLTIVISYISFRIKQSKGTADQRQEIPNSTVFKNKKRIEEELKPHYKTKHLKPPPPKRERRRPEEKEKSREPKSESPPKPHSDKKREVQKNEPKQTNRIERVRDLGPNDKSLEERSKRTVEKRRIENEDKKNKKKLNSIDDDPLNKYTDSADDELHPLKTDD